MTEYLQESPVRIPMYISGNGSMAGIWRAFFRDVRVVKADRDPNALENDLAVFDSNGNPVAGADVNIGSYLASLLVEGTGVTLSLDEDTGYITITTSLDDFDTDNLAEGLNLYYTNDRVDDQVETFLDTGVHITLTRNNGTMTVATTGVKKSRILKKTDNYTITSGDISTYEIFRMNNVASKTFTFPSLAEGDDGTRFRIANIGGGRLTCQMPAGYKISNSPAAGSIYTDNDYAVLELEFCYDTLTYLKIGEDGSWTVPPTASLIDLEDLPGSILAEDGTYLDLEDP